MAPGSNEQRFRPIVHLENAVPRERIAARILDAPPTSARLTLVLAPAGFGKTTSLGQLAARLAAHGERVAWLNCDPQDREAAVFADDLCRALTAIGLPDLHPHAGVADIVEALGLTAERVTIFVDRYEVATGADADALIVSLARLLPAGSRCIVASRVPLSISSVPLQLEGSLRIVEVETLRFTDPEAREMLSSNWSRAAVEQVVERAAGWPFVLQLARLRMATGDQDPMPTSGRAALPIQQVFDYLATQIFSALRADDIAFLVEISILETIDVAAANAVRGRSDSAGHIERLVQLKPIVVVDAEPLTATLHPLLRVLLRSMLERNGEGALTATLHARAAEHFAACGALHDAVTHAVLAGRLEFAASILADAGGVCLLMDQGVGRIKTLLQLLPPAIVRQQPRLRLLRIAQLLVEENGPEARLDFDRLAMSLGIDQDGRADADALDDRTRVDLSLVRLLLSINEAEHEFRFTITPKIEEAVTAARTQYCEDSRPLVLALAVEIALLQRYGPLERAERRTQEAERLHIEGAFSYNVPWTWIYKARNAYARGDLETAKAELLKASGQELDIVTFTHGSFGQLVHALLAKLHYDQGALDEAFRHFEAIAPVNLMTLFEIHQSAYVYYPMCEFARGNATRALEMLAHAREYATDEDLPHLEVLAAAHEVRVLLAIGRLDDARALAMSSSLEHVRDSARGPGALPEVAAEAVGAACFALMLAEGRSGRAAVIARDALAQALNRGRRLAEIDARLMTARLATDRGDPAEARAAVGEALAAAGPGRVVQPFLGAGADVLSIVREVAMAPGHAFAAAAGRIVARWDEGFQLRNAGDTLFTPRERDVLRGLVKGQSTKLIARELTLSPETIKHHLKSIFSKLGVRSRDDVVAEVRRRAVV